MLTAFHTTATVLAGQRIEVTAPDLREREKVQVVVIPAGIPAKLTPRPSALELIRSLNGHRLFQSVEEVDKYINEERDSGETNVE